MRLLCVAEKNSIAKEVARILSGGSARTRDSTYKFVKNYDFSYTFPDLGPCDVTMTAVSGHILATDFGADYAWGRCSPGRLFDAPITSAIPADKDQRSQKIHANIVREARKANRLMVWTDCDREGEYIGWEIASVAAQVNSRLSLHDTWRAHFSHLEPAHIQAAALQPKRLDMKLVAAVACRREFDLRVGTAFTRLLTTVYRSRHLVGDRDVVSYGTCQFPTLSFVVDRYVRVRQFVPEPFWRVDAVAEQDGKRVPLLWARTRLFDRAFAAAVYEQLMAGPPPTVSNVSTRPTSHFRPLPLTTVDLQKCCVRYFGLLAKQALDAAELLYTAGYVSYPRTETNRFPAEMDVGAYVAKQAGDARWGSYAERLGAGELRRPRAGTSDDKAHPPIYPVKYAGPTALLGAQAKVYEFVVRRFLACCSDDARGLQTSVDVTWGTEQFKASGLHVTHRNFLDVYPYSDWRLTAQLPEFRVGDTVNIASAKLASGTTLAPSYMTEAELIALMDANGIGTDATIAEHIDKIEARNYVVRRRMGRTEVFVPTTLGMALIRALDAILAERILLLKPYLRRALEGFLQRIALGELSREAVVAELLPMYREAFRECSQKSLVLVLTFVETSA